MPNLPSFHSVRAFVWCISEVRNPETEASVRALDKAGDPAYYTLRKLDKEPSLLYKGQHDPVVLFEALETLRR